MRVLVARGKKLITAIDKTLRNQGDIAKEIGISHACLSFVARRKRSTTEETATKIAKYFGREVDYFFISKPSKRKKISNAS